MQIHSVKKNFGRKKEGRNYCDKLQKAGQLLDGPFAETKEQLGGFLMIDVPHLNDAIRVAAHFPAARFGSVEVRPMNEPVCA